MNYTTVGLTEVKVSPLCFGTMSFGSEADESTSAAMFARVREKASTSSTAPTSTVAKHRRRSWAG